MIGDSILRYVKPYPAAIVRCIKGARVGDIEENLKLLAKSNHEYSKVIIQDGDSIFLSVASVFLHNVPSS